MATRQKVLKGAKALQDHKHPKGQQGLKCLKWQQGKKTTRQQRIKALKYYKAYSPKGSMAQ